MRGEKPAPPLRANDPKEELDVKNAQTASEAQALIEHGIEWHLNNQYGKTDLAAFECRDKLVKEGKLKQSQYQQMLMERMTKDKGKPASKSSEMRKRTDHFFEYMTHRFVNKTPISALSGAGQFQEPSSPVKLDAKD